MSKQFTDRAWYRRLSKADQRDLDVLMTEARMRESDDPAEKQQLAEMVRALKALKLEGGTMPDNGYRSAVQAFTDGVAAPLAELASLEADREKYPERYYAKARAEILARARIGDEVAQTAIAAYRRDATAEAQRLRAAAEAGRDPAARMADELERQRLATSPIDGDAFVQQAWAMLAAGQPARASLLLGVALDKGWKGGLASDPSTGQQYSVRARLRADIDAALDAADPDRARALAIEQAVVTDTDAFQAERLRVLADRGAGIGGDGLAGAGEAKDVARASAAAKTRAWHAAQASGQLYSAPAGTLDSVPTGGMLVSRDGSA